MTPTDRARAAQTVLEIPFFTDLLAEIEKAAIDRCLNAQINDDETRRNEAAEARAVRKLRSKLEAISNEGQSTSRQAPA